MRPTGLKPPAPIHAATSAFVLTLLLAHAAAAQAQLDPRQSYGPYRGQVIVDTSVLDQLGRDPYARGGATVPYGASSYGQGASRPEPPGLLPPPGPGELAKRQAQINAAARQVKKPDPAAAKEAPAKAAPTKVAPPR